ncbi:MAG: UDP-3-O-acyl-N-acetylglucosamine deacetylase [Acidobacteriota bacterium]
MEWTRWVSDRVGRQQDVFSTGSHRQHSLSKPATCRGIGLHGGRPVTVQLLPAPSDTGLVFTRTDIGRRVDIPATIDRVSEVDHATSLSGDGTQVGTVEHLLSALAGLGVDNCRIEVDGPELPILDGSSAPWVYLLHEAGLQPQRAPRRVRRITRSFTHELDHASLSVHPAHRLRLTCVIDFDHPAIGRQEASVTVEPRSFAETIAPARTFGFLHEVESLRRAGLVKGGSYSNAIVLDEHGVLNGQLRFPDEFVRHKLLDLLGDLALTGPPLQGHVVARCAGHRSHASFGRALLASSHCWRIEEKREPSQRHPVRATGATTPPLSTPAFGLGGSAASLD